MKAGDALVSGMGLLAGLAIVGSTAQDGEEGGVGGVRGVLDRVASRIGTGGQGLLAPLSLWPVATNAISSLGDDATVRRRTGLHQGIDIHAPAGSAVVAPEPLTVITVGNGTGSADEHKRRAGLWVDGRGNGGRILRFLHLATGSVRVKLGQKVETGDVIGEVAAKGDSGNESSAPHLHFEVRRSDWKKGPDARPINPVDVLPNTGPPHLLRQLAALRMRSRDRIA